MSPHTHGSCGCDPLDNYTCSWHRSEEYLRQEVERQAESATERMRALVSGKLTPHTTAFDAYRMGFCPVWDEEDSDWLKAIGISTEGLT
jgi:hypothetical protein